MALIYRAELSPTKQELIAAWLPSQPCFTGSDAGSLEHVGAYRFDDPDGEVGLETHLVSVDGTLFQVPLSYRGAALEGAEASLVGTMEHSVLGRRWVYDACGDPVYATALLTALTAGPAQADEFVVVEEGEPEQLPWTVHVERHGPTVGATPETGHPDPVALDAYRDDSGQPSQLPVERVITGSTTILRMADLKVSVLRIVEPVSEVLGECALTGRWDGGAEPVQLAALGRVVP